MDMRFALVATFLAAASPAASVQATQQPASDSRQAVIQPQPRSLAQEVARAVEDIYFDAARGHSIAQGLRARAAAGAFDRMTNPLDLATALSSYLHPFDGHFTVVYRPEVGGLPGERRAPPAAAPPGARPGPGAPAAGPRQLALARQNYGFVRTEMLPGAIGYIAVNQFAPIDPRSPADPARMAADAALQSVAGAQAIILDLRDSRGGAPAMVAYLASYFVPAGAPIFNTFHTRGADGSEAPIVDPTGPRRLDVPLYILVNGGTGSASESFPYTLQAAHRAVIVGEPTNGRANPGGFVRLSGGFAVFVSGGAPENPITHSNWEGRGVQPDIMVASQDALARAQDIALQRLLEADPQGPGAGELRWLLADRHASAPVLSAAALEAYAGSYGEEASVTSADGALVLHQGRRAVTLRPLASDLFVFATDPIIHARFERGGTGIAALTILTPAGPVARYVRAPSR
jgi:hypothetical protein